MASEPAIKAFRDRARAISLFFCKGAKASDFGISVEGMTYDLLVEPHAEPVILCALQGRLEAEDVVSVELVDGFNMTRWNQIQRVGRRSGNMASYLSFELDGLADLRDAEYDLLVRCNDRLCGRARVRIRILRNRS